MYCVHTDVVMRHQQKLVKLHNILGFADEDTITSKMEADQDRGS